MVCLRGIVVCPSCHLLFYFIFLYENLFQPMRSQRASTPRKEKREGGRKGKAQRVKLPTPLQATDALIRDEEQNRKQENKKKQGGVPNLSALDHLVSYDVQGSYSELILFTPPTCRVIYMSVFRFIYVHKLLHICGFYDATF